MPLGGRVRRYTTLDGLRGSAALAVMFFHADGQIAKIATVHFARTQT